jgi:hypothetical protein
MLIAKMTTIDIIRALDAEIRPPTTSPSPSSWRLRRSEKTHSVRSSTGKDRSGTEKAVGQSKE